MGRKIGVVDLFSGAGGFSHGFRSAGFRVLAGIDNDPYSINTYRLNFKTSRAINEDLRALSSQTKSFIRSIKSSTDVVVGGPPCQGFSIAGKRLADDPRNKLYKEYIEVVDYLRPTYVVMENVPTILSLKNGKISQGIISDLELLGYQVAVCTVNASDYGIPQNRRRTFFIGKLRSTPVSFKDIEKVSEKLTTFDAISDLPYHTRYFSEDPLPYTKSPKNEYQSKMREKSELIYNHWCVEHKPETTRIINMVPDGGNYKDLPRSLQSTRKVNIAWTRMNSKKPSFTIDAGHNHHFHYSANRVPTVRESARIQSFPDNFVFKGIKTSQFRQVGNAVPPLLVKGLARMILRDIS